MYAHYGTDDPVPDRLNLIRRAAQSARYMALPATGAAVAAIVSTLSRVAGPLVIREGIDGGIIPQDTSVITTAALVFAGIVVAQYVSTRFTLYTVAWMGERFMMDLRNKIYAHVLRMDMAFFGRTKTGVLVSRLTSDIESLQVFASEGALSVVGSTLMVTGVSIALFVVDPFLAGLAMLLMPFLLFASYRFGRRSAKAYRQWRGQIAKVLAALSENISGVREVQANAQEQRQEERFSGIDKVYYQKAMKAAKTVVDYFPRVDALRAVGLAMVLFIGGNRVLDGQMTLGSLIAFLLYLNWFFEPIVQLANVYNLLQGALAALYKLYGLADEQPTIREPSRPVTLPSNVKGEIEMNQVTFGYDPGEQVLSDMTLRIPAGQRLAVVGATGSGKSTMVKLLARLYDPQTGSIKLDDIELQDLSFADLRRSVALVPQEGFLFEDSLRFNLAFGMDEISDSELWEACRATGIAEWVKSLPEGLDTPMRERGNRLSSGERQLVALTRALMVEPAIVILDEATSNLDPETEDHIEEAIETLLAGRTSIVVAHRLRTARRADRVLVMAGGQVVEDGSYDELAGRGGPFAELIRTWESSEVLRANTQPSPTVGSSLPNGGDTEWPNRSADL
jgi:ATP-binding cassette subfamily B protein